MAAGDEPLDPTGPLDGPPPRGPAPRVRPGTRLGPFEVGERLGAGGMGEVFRARDARLGRDVAIKVLPQGLTADPESLRRFAIRGAAPRGGARRPPCRGAPAPRGPRAQRPRRYISPSVLAAVDGALGDVDAAFTLLQRGRAERDFLLVLLRVEPIFDSLRADPRFDALVAEMGFPR